MTETEIGPWADHPDIKAVNDWALFGPIGADVRHGKAGRLARVPRRRLRTWRNSPQWLHNGRMHYF